MPAELDSPKTSSLGARGVPKAVKWLILTLIFSNGGDFGYKEPKVNMGLEVRSTWLEAGASFSPTDKVSAAGHGFGASGLILAGSSVFLATGPSWGHMTTETWSKSAFRWRIGAGWRDRRSRVYFLYTFPLRDMNKLKEYALRVETTGRLGLYFSVGKATYWSGGAKYAVPSVGGGVKWRMQR